MKSMVYLTTIAALAAALTGCFKQSNNQKDGYLGAHHPPHSEWGYPGQDGKILPDDWHTVSPNDPNHRYIACQLGVRESQRQSPINIETTTASPSKATPIKFHYLPTDFAVFHNRHTVEYEDREKKP